MFWPIDPRYSGAWRLSLVACSDVARQATRTSDRSTIDRCPAGSSFSTARRAPARRPSLVPCKGCQTSLGFALGSTLSGPRSMSGGWSTASRRRGLRVDGEREDRARPSRAAARGGHASSGGCSRSRRQLHARRRCLRRRSLARWMAQRARWPRVALRRRLAPLDMLEERETARGNRIAGEARFQFDLIHSGSSTTSPWIPHVSRPTSAPARSCRRSCADLGVRLCSGLFDPRYLGEKVPPSQDRIQAWRSRTPAAASAPSSVSSRVPVRSCGRTRWRPARSEARGG